jgi:hypothetical protein
LRLEKDWTPMLTYAKADAPGTLFGENHLKSFTFVPTKQGHKDFTMSLLLDANGVWCLQHFPSLPASALQRRQDHLTSVHYRYQGVLPDSGT